MTEPTDGRGTALTEAPRITPSTTEEKPRAERKANVPIPFDAGLVESIQIDRSAVERRAATIPTRRGFKKEQQVAAYIWGIRCCDHTELGGASTPGSVRRLCTKALNPVRRDILKALGLGDLDLTVGAVCVYPAQVATAVAAVRGKIPVASVATGFPDGQTPLHVKLAEIAFAIGEGASEIDIVVNGDLAQRHQWHALYDEIVACREACGENVHMKVILRTGECGTMTEVAKRSAIAIMAGADFIKTSTGKEKINATLPVGLVMVREIRRFQDLGLLHGHRIGFKPAGGIETAKDGMAFLALMLDELGVEWTKPALFRFGESRLLPNFELQLEHLATGRYSAKHRHPKG